MAFRLLCCPFLCPNSGWRQAKKSIDLMVALYRKRIWTDAKTVNVLASALFSDVSKIKVTAINFFLHAHEMDDDDDEDDESGRNAKDKTYDEMLKNNASVKTRKRDKQLKKQLQKEKRKETRQQKGETYDFQALHLLHDPQGLCEKMFADIKSSKERWEVQLMQMNLISRLISIHELVLLNFYPYLERYLWPTKPDVTQVLTYVAQACHEYVPPDALESVLLKIAYNFISERSAPPVMAVGMNAIREICKRCPHAMNEALLQDLAQYKKYKDKGVMTAAKGLISAYRELNPEMLHKRDRGRPDDNEEIEEKALEYGQQVAAGFVPGVELLSMYHERKAAAAARAAAGEADEEDVAGNAEWESDDGEEGAAGEDDDEEDGEEEDGVEGGDGEEEEDGWADVVKAAPTAGGAAAKKAKTPAPAVLDWEEDGEGMDGKDSDDDEGGWVDVKHNDDDTDRTFNAGSDDEADEKVEDEVSKEERVRRATNISQQRLLTQDDFERIKTLRMEAKLMPAGGLKRQRMQEKMREEAVDVNDILPDSKKARQNKEERLADVMAGRDERGKFNVRKGHDGGLTNRQKASKKNPMMIKERKAKQARTTNNFKAKCEAKSQKKRFRGKR
jgi:protein SDA1